MDVIDDPFFPDNSLTFEAPSTEDMSPNAIRDTIKDEVNSILWLDKLVAEEKIYEERLSKIKSTTEKCMICTLPYGTCVHTKDWIQNSYQARTTYYDNDLDKTIEDMLNVIDEYKVETAPVLDDVDLTQMQWSALDERPTDKIGTPNTGIKLSLQPTL